MADGEGSVKVIITAEEQRALDSGAYHLISSEAAEDLVDQGGVTILDVRSPQEYGDGHLRDSLNMRYDSFDQLPPELEGLDRDAPVLAYCRTGNRARKPARSSSTTASPTCTTWTRASLTRSSKNRWAARKMTSKRYASGLRSYTPRRRVEELQNASAIPACAAL